MTFQLSQTNISKFPEKAPLSNDDDRDNEVSQSRSTLISRNLTILGHRTSMRLEPEMWAALKDVSRREQSSMHNICSLVALRKTPQSSLTAAIRVFLLLYYRASSTDEAHMRVGHGNFDIMKRRARVTDDMLRGFIPN